MEFYLNKSGILFSDELIGEILSRVKGDDKSLVEKYSAAIKSRLKAGSISLKKDKINILNEIQLILNVYESCFPINKETFPNIDTTLKLFNTVQQNKQNIFTEYNLGFDSLYYIFLINSKYFIFNYDNRKNNSAFKNLLDLKVPEKLELAYNFAYFPLKEIDDTFVKEYVKLNKLSSVESGKFGENWYESSYSFIINSFEQFRLLEDKDHYVSLRIIIAIASLNRCNSLIDKSHRDTLSIYSQEHVQEIKEIKSKLINVKLTPFYEVFRNALKKNYWDLTQVLDFINMNTGGHLEAKKIIIINYLSALILENDKVGFARNYNTLKKKFGFHILDNPNSISLLDMIFSYYDMLYIFLEKKLDPVDLEEFMTRINKIDEFKFSNAIFLTIAYKFALLINDEKTIDSINQMHIFEEEEKEMIINHTGAAPYNSDKKLQSYKNKLRVPIFANARVDRR